MATKIPTGTTSYFTDFAGGQGAGISAYYTYAQDHDTNYQLLRQTINQICDELSAVSGPNSSLAIELVHWNDDENPIDPTEPPHGVIGAGSYEVSVEGGGTLKIRRGQALLNGQKVSMINDLTGVTSSGGAGTRWVALDANGTVYIESSADQRTLDVASVTWNGTIFTGTPTHLAHVFFDGDAWAEVRDRAVTPDVAALGAYTFRRGANRIRALELFLAGQDTGAEGEAIAGPFALLPGAVGAPAIILGDGSSSFDTTTGWYRVAANNWAFAASGAEVLRLLSTGIQFPSGGTAAAPRVRLASGGGIFFPSAESVALASNGAEVLRADMAQALLAVLGSAATPVLSILGDLNTGLYSPAADELAFTLGGVKRLHLAGNQVRVLDGGVGAPAVAFDADLDTGLYRPTDNELAATLGGTKRVHLAGDQIRARDGVVGGPAYTFDSDPDTGLYSPGANRLGVGTGGALRLEADAAGNIDLPTNMGAIVRRAAAQGSIVTATLTSISWDTEDRDIGGWIAVTSTDLTCPSDGDGLYLITLEVTWASSSTGYRRILIEAAGSNYGPEKDNAESSGAHEQATSTIVPLSASDVVRGRVEHSVGSDHSISSARLAIQKIA